MKKSEQKPLLEVRHVSTNYGNIRALKDVSFTVYAGEIVCLIGANGAGKTTMLKTICGLLTPQSGEIEFEGQPISQLPAHEIVGRGIAMVPEGRQIFSRLIHPGKHRDGRLHPQR